MFGELAEPDDNERTFNHSEFIAENLNPDMSLVGYSVCINKDDAT